MSLVTKFIVVFLIVVVVLAIIVILLFTSFSREEVSLPTYTPSPEESSVSTTQSPGSTIEETRDTTSVVMYSPYIEILAYRRNTSDKVIIYIEVSLWAREGDYFYIVEARINNYTQSHPLYRSTIKQYGAGQLITSNPVSIKFELTIPSTYLKEWDIGSIHTLYIKLRIPPTLRTIKEIGVPFIIQEEGKAVKQLTRIPLS